MKFPSGEKQTLQTEELTSKVQISSPFFLFHIFIVQSDDPEITLLPSGEKATLQTAPVCPFKFNIYSPVAVDHILTVLSEEPETM